jgi:hypothetical protein
VFDSREAVEELDFPIDDLAFKIRVTTPEDFHFPEKLAD